MLIHKVTQEPEVGIFWLYRQKLLKHSVPVSTGMEYGDFINGPLGHYEFWNMPGNRIPEVRDREYDQVPRGRVLYAKQDNIFYVYASTRTLASSAKKQRILKAFSLDREHVIFSLDEHYEEIEECSFKNIWDESL